MGIIVKLPVIGPHLSVDLALGSGRPDGDERGMRIVFRKSHEKISD